MISSKYTQLLYKALSELMDAAEWDDVLEVGGQPLQKAWEDAVDLLNEINAPYPLIDILSKALEFIAPCQSEEAIELTTKLADMLNSLRGEND